jgi:hypothetical protein
MYISDVFHRLFANSQLPLFQQTFFFKLFAPAVLPLVRRWVKHDYMQSWVLFMMIWAIAMLVLPIVRDFMTIFLSQVDLYLVDEISSPLSIGIQWLLDAIQVWGLYYIIRLHITKNFYWCAEKYPDWPTRSIFIQMDRYIYRPEVFALLMVTFFWILLNNYLSVNGLPPKGQQLDWMDYLQLWLPWFIGGLWPMVSVFYHKQTLVL